MPSSLELSAFGLTLFAGLSTGIGSLIALLAKRKTSRFLSMALGFSAGVMVYVSLVEIFQEARLDLAAIWGPKGGYLGAVAGFFGGIALIALIDKLVPPVVNPHESRAGEAATYEAADLRACPAEERDARRHGRLLRTGLFTAFVVALHNFPEGIATFLAALKSPRVGLAVALAIAIHNIPGASPSPSPSTSRRARGAEPSGTPSPRASPSPPAPSSATSSSGPTWAAPSSASSPQAWPASWSTSHWTSSCPPRASSASPTSRWAAWSRAWR